MKKLIKKVDIFCNQPLNHKQMRIFVFVLLWLGCVNWGYSQNSKTISGKVTDQSDTPIIGASVIVEGTSLGTVTDLDGIFTLQVPETGKKIKISYLGYTSKEIILGAASTINVVLEEDSKLIDEVVVVGYGVQKKVNLSGSVASVKMDELVESRPITNISQGLAGMAAGVHVNSGSNRPGENNATIMVRGQGTLNNSEPLVIIDGAEGNLNSVNPQDIEDLTVLKDAASSAIYGSRAANGVILITTKKGKQGKMKIDFNSYLTWESVGENFDMVSNYADYMELMNEGYKNTKQPVKFSDDIIKLWRDNQNGDQLKYPNVNIMDEMFKTSLGSNHNLSINGGSEKIRFYTSFGYLNSPGVMENSGFEKYSTRLNLEADPLPWLKIGTNFSGYMGFIEPGSDVVKTVFDSANATSPGMILRAPDGRYGAPNNIQDDSQMAINNPLARLNKTGGQIETRNMKSRFFGTLAPFKGFTLSGSFTYNFTNKTNDSKPIFIPQWNFLTNQLFSSGIVKTNVKNKDEKWNNYTADAVARYENTVSKLDYSVLIGASQELYRFKWFEATKQDLLDPGLSVINGATGQSTSAGNTIEWAMRSYFGRINMAWDSKYLVEFNLRADASSRFLKDHRWGYFPSGSFAWRIDQEPFMANLTSSWLDNLKLRASYGSLGNNTLGKKANDDGNYMAQSLYEIQNYVLNNEVAMGVAQKAIPNPLLTWEKTNVTNIGFDFGILKNKLSGTVDYFYKQTKDILIDLPAPLVNGNAKIPRQNAATVVNKGLELSLNWQDKIGDFSYFVSGNITFINNEVTKYKGDEMTLDKANMIKQGYPINTQYVLSVDRIVQTQADLDLVQSMIDKNPKAFNTYKRPELGDFLYKDTNGDGVINADDRITVGKGKNPPIVYGLNLGGSYKGFDISVLMQGVSGVKVNWTDNYFRPHVNYGNQINAKIAEGRWYPGIPEGTAKYPRLLQANDNRNNLPSDFWVQNKSYLKIKNIQLGYTFPKQLLSSFSIEKIRIYGSLENFFTFTDYDGLDPEIDGVTYPTMKQAVVGINVSF